MGSQPEQGAVGEPGAETVPYEEQKVVFGRYAQEIQDVVEGKLEEYPDHVTDKPGEVPPTTKVLELSGGITLELIDSRYERGSRMTVDGVMYQIIFKGPDRHMMRVGEGIGHVMPWTLDGEELGGMIARAKAAAPSA